MYVLGGEFDNGTASCSAVPSGLGSFAFLPNAKALGYYRLSLRDRWRNRCVHFDIAVVGRQWPGEKRCKSPKSTLIWAAHLRTLSISTRLY